MKGITKERLVYDIRQGGFKESLAAPYVYVFSSKNTKYISNPRLSPSWSYPKRWINGSYKRTLLGTIRSSLWQLIRPFVNIYDYYIWYRYCLTILRKSRI